MEKEYPKLMMPIELASKKCRDMSKKDALAHFKWRMSEKEIRVAGLLSYFEEKLTGNSEDDFERIGLKINDEIKKEEFSFIENEVMKLTNLGYTIGYDAGLLMAQLLIADTNGKVSWALAKLAPRDIDFNRPVLIGFGMVTSDPCRIGINLARSDGWRNVYQNWKKQVTGECTKKIIFRESDISNDSGKNKYTPEMKKIVNENESKKAIDKEKKSK